MKKKTIYLILLVLLTIVNCVLLFFNLSNQEKIADDKATPQLNGGWVEKTYVQPEVILKNADIKDFCEHTLIPVLREIEFNPVMDVVTMSIEEDRDAYKLKFFIMECESLENDELPNGCIEAFYPIDGFNIKVEAPKDCALIEITSNNIEVKHKEKILFIVSDPPEWFFHMEGDSMVLDEVLNVGESDTFEGKVMNLQTGRLTEEV